MRLCPKRSLYSFEAQPRMNKGSFFWAKPNAISNIDHGLFNLHLQYISASLQRFTKSGAECKSQERHLIIFQIAFGFAKKGVFIHPWLCLRWIAVAHVISHPTQKLTQLSIQNKPGQFSHQLIVGLTTQCTLSPVWRTVVLAATNMWALLTRNPETDGQPTGLLPSGWMDTPLKVLVSTSANQDILCQICNL